MEEKTDPLLDKVILFLVILVSLMMLYNSYYYHQLNSGVLSYLSFLLILVLGGLIAWYLVEKEGSKKAHESHAHAHAHANEASKPWTFMEKLSYGLVVLVGVMVIFNQLQLSQASALLGVNSGLTLKFGSSKTSLKLTGDPTQDAMTIIIPRGTPFYGEGLGVSFDDPINGLEIIANLDPTYGRTKVQLAGEEKQRYINILTTPTITCEFCCGVKTAVTKEGRPTCGCKHSWAMRGLTAYLIKNYPQMSDDEIKREVTKWKGLFFPKQMIQRYIEESQSGQYTPDIASLLLDVDEAKLNEMREKVAAQGPASGGDAPAASIDDLPSMVGGC